MTRTAYLALGSNLGPRRFHLRAALRRIARFPQTWVTAVSYVYDTAPVGCADPGRYLNAVVRCETLLAPEDLLRRCLAAETALGRTRPYRNAPRTIDIDLLLWGDARRETDFLTLPHPRMWERAFVLRPLLDAAADPALRARAAAALAALPAQDVFQKGGLSL